MQSLEELLKDSKLGMTCQGVNWVWSRIIQCSIFQEIKDHLWVGRRRWQGSIQWWCCDTLLFPSPSSHWEKQKEDGTRGVQHSFLFLVRKTKGTPSFPSPWLGLQCGWEASIPFQSCFDFFFFLALPNFILLRILSFEGSRQPYKLSLSCSLYRGPAGRGSTLRGEMMFWGMNTGKCKIFLIITLLFYT